MLNQSSRLVVVILKRFLPRQQKISVFTESFGRINLTIKKRLACERLWPSMTVACDVIKLSRGYVAENIDIYALPAFGCHKSLYLMHHLFELCCFFSPLESPSVEIYRFLRDVAKILCMRNLFIEEWHNIELICIAKFLSKVGFYDTGGIHQSLSLFDALTLLSVDFHDDQQVEFLKEKMRGIRKEELNEWILTYLKNHPDFNSFKTVVFHYS